MLKNNYSNHMHGFTDMKSLNERGPIVISYGKGIYVYDIQNKEYLDANSGLWNSCAGFDHPGIIEVAQKQYSKFGGYHSLFGRLSEETVKLATSLLTEFDTVCSGQTCEIYKEYIDFTYNIISYYKNQCVN